MTSDKQSRHENAAAMQAGFNDPGIRIRQLAAIANATPDAILSIDADQIIVFANPAASLMFRCPAENILGASIERFIPPRFRNQHRQYVKEFGRSGVTARKMAGHMVVTGMRDDETEFPLEASISQIHSEGRPIFTVILRDITIRLQAEGELEFARSQLRMLTARQRSLHENEQRRLSRELHDDIGQRLSALKMDIAMLRGALPAEQPELFDTIEAMDELLSGTVGAVRRLASGLRPKILDELGLSPALETFLIDMESRFDLKFELNIDDEFQASEQQSIELFRIVQEAVHNVAKHANATRVVVNLARKDGYITLIVKDDGQGMRSNADRKPGALGLLGISERVTGLDGEMQIRSSPGSGTTVSCRFPQAGHKAGVA